MEWEIGWTQTTPPSTRNFDNSSCFYQIIITNEAYYDVLAEMAMHMSSDLNPTDDLKNVRIRTKTKELVYLYLTMVLNLLFW
mmetsp:Transcript_18491/g.28103  ORF Transcript_18491/g.28103 Transcript_18491/m.28103 type:complete len:82 (-) Transcript_18491:46-291(-)